MHLWILPGILHCNKIAVSHEDRRFAKIGEHLNLRGLLPAAFAPRLGLKLGTDEPAALVRLVFRQDHVLCWYVRERHLQGLSKSW